MHGMAAQAFAVLTGLAQVLKPQMPDCQQRSPRKTQPRDEPPTYATRVRDMGQPAYPASLPQTRTAIPPSISFARQASASRKTRPSPVSLSMQVTLSRVQSVHLKLRVSNSNFKLSSPLGSRLMLK